MVSTESPIADNYRLVQRRITQACARAGRSISSVELVAVTKYAENSWIRELLALGHSDLGESRPQQLLERAALFGPTVRWHLIGHLQRNKIRRVLPLTALIHSVDSLRLLTAIDRIAGELEHKPKVLLEVNISGEQAKHGFKEDELLEDWKKVLECREVSVAGLMTMAPCADDPETARPVFRQLRELRDQLRSVSPSAEAIPELSMGMSRDFEVAIEEGATIVRIGTDLYRGMSER